jgi:hypothetical protein
MMKNNTVDKTSPEFLQKQAAGARSSLLVVLIFTVVNLAMLLLDAGTYFLFSASVPYYLTAFGMGMDIGIGAEGIGTFTVVGLGISAVVLVLYLLSWLLSKKRSGWLVAALVLFILDTLALVVLCLAFDALAESVMDFVFHGWVIIQLIQGVSAGKKLKNLPAEALAPEAEQPAAPTELPWERSGN